MENRPDFKMYFLRKWGIIPASYVSLPEGINVCLDERSFFICLFG